MICGSDLSAFNESLLDLNEETSIEDSRQRLKIRRQKTEEPVIVHESSPEQLAENLKAVEVARSRRVHQFDQSEVFCESAAAFAAHILEAMVYKESSKDSATEQLAEKVNTVEVARSQRVYQFDQSLVFCESSAAFTAHILEEMVHEESSKDSAPEQLAEEVNAVEVAPPPRVHLDQSDVFCESAAAFAAHMLESKLQSKSMGPTDSASEDGFEQSVSTSYTQSEPEDVDPDHFNSSDESDQEHQPEKALSNMNTFDTGMPCSPTATCPRVGPRGGLMLLPQQAR